MTGVQKQADTDMHPSFAAPLSFRGACLAFRILIFLSRNRENNYHEQFIYLCRESFWVS